MAELTELGLLEQPHTSAGRVPSQEGYREFVDALMQPKTLTEAEKLTIDAMLAKSAFDPERLLRGAAKTLAASTRYLALSTTPSGADAKIKAVPVRADEPPHRNAHYDEQRRYHEKQGVSLRL